MNIKYKQINHRERAQEQSVDLDSDLEIKNWLTRAREKQQEHFYSYIEIDCINFGQNKIHDAFEYLENRKRILKVQQ